MQKLAPPLLVALATLQMPDCLRQKEELPQAYQSISFTLDAKKLSAGPLGVMPDSERTSERVEIARSALASDRAEKVKPLWVALKENREIWKQKNPARSFDGSVDIKFDGSTPCHVLRNLWVTSAYAGYPTVTLHYIGLSVKFEVTVPGPPRSEDDPAPQNLPLRIRFHAGGKASMRFTCTGTPEMVNAGEIASVAKATSVKTAPVALGCEDGSMAPEVFMVLSDLSRDGPIFVDVDGCVPDAPASPTAVPPPSFPKAKVKEGAITATGNLSVDDIRSALQTARHDLDRCYAMTLQSNQLLGGKIDFRLKIAPDGGVIHVGTGGDLTNGDIRRCTVAGLSRVVFPRHGQGIVEVTYPVTFSPK